MRKIYLFVFIAMTAIVAGLMYQYSPIGDLQYLRRVNHETYAPGEANYEFCTARCTQFGGYNCGKTRKGCCQPSLCKANKIYGWEECATGGSVKLNTTRCIGSWN